MDEDPAFICSKDGVTRQDEDAGGLRVWQQPGGGGGPL